MDGHRYEPFAMGNVQVWFDGNGPPPLRDIALMRRLEWHQAIAFPGVLRLLLQQASRP
jgi:hypothetical protein